MQTVSHKKNIRKLTWETVEKEQKEGKLQGVLALDVRSEDEYAKGHISGAVNLPVLSNSERHQVGCIYKNCGKQAAIEIGLEIFANKAKRFLSSFDQILLNQTPYPKHFLVYCWRGGMRSGAVAKLLTALGHKVSILEGGYKAYRKRVLNAINRDLPKHQFLVLHGLTGTGKTELIKEAIAEGIPSLDLEGLAQHRGSAFGDFNQRKQPLSQQQFENELYQSYHQQRHEPIFLVEIEGRLGEVNIHPVLRQKITDSPMLHIVRPIAERVAYLVREYTSHWTDDTTVLFLERICRLKDKIPKEKFFILESLVQEKRFSELTEILLQVHYDVLYGKSLRKYNALIIRQFSMNSEKKLALKYIKDYIYQFKYDIAG